MTAVHPHAALFYQCPFCSAGPGTPCLTKFGRVQQLPGKSRAAALTVTGVSRARFGAHRRIRGPGDGHVVARW
jgi:hypothetical protein